MLHAHSRAVVVLASLVVLFAAACSPKNTLGTGGSGGGVGAGNGTGNTATGTGGSQSAGTESSGTQSTGASGACTPDCTPGNLCQAGTCVPGCDASHPCDSGKSCCSGTCSDTTTDPKHCGSCDGGCAMPPNIEVGCNGTCTFGACAPGFFDCDGNKDNGCESSTACSCTPGASQACYDGPMMTANNAPCHGGMQVCNASGTGWGPCNGEVVPITEICANGIDDDCDGTADNVPDLDGDGWTVCDGDCCDVSGGCGATPALINPGAFEVPGNMVDDDCDGTVDNALGACDSALASNSSDPLDYAKAIDLCASTVEIPASLSLKKWGVISGGFFLADGTGTPAANSRSIRQGFGGGVSPLDGARIAVLSTGIAAASVSPNNTSPNYGAPQGGQNMGTSSPVPADWIAANGNNFPNAPGCPDPNGGQTAHDPIELKLRVRVPTNAQSFSVSSFFYSTEYPEWVCSAFNDFFLTLLDSTFVPTMMQTANPADKNLAFYDPPPAGPPYYPVGVNLAFGNTGLFTQCKNGPTGCGGGATAGNSTTCTSTAQLAGTGFDVLNPSPQFVNDPGYCGASNLSGGGSGWLTTSGNVKPGETIELRFVIWDTGDQWYDSTVLLDNFQWSLQPATPGTHN